MLTGNAVYFADSIKVVANEKLGYHDEKSSIKKKKSGKSYVRSIYIFE
jgi:hypothetical protein